MPDREKVIKETEDGIAFAESRGFGGLANTMRDAIALLKDCDTQLQYRDDHIAMYQAEIKRLEALLKEQEAHLLDMSEIYTAHKLDVWIEEKSDNAVYPLMLVETEMTDKRQAAFFYPMTVRHVKAYGKTWRCWSARPTDEQRKTVKWE